MPEFLYKARRDTGEAVEGIFEASTREAVAARLQAQNAIPISIVKKEEDKKNLVTYIKEWFSPKSIPLTELAMFSRQMHSLTKAGVPLTKAIQGLIETSNRELFKQVLRDILDALAAGNDLASSFSRHPHIFNSLYISIVHVGENSGRLDESFLQISKYIELEEENINRVKSATRYPIIVMSVLVIAFVVINMVVIPKLSSLFKRFSNDELPFFTQVLIGTSDFMVNYWYILFAITLLAFFALRNYIQTKEGRLFWDEKKLKMPLFGSIIYRSLLARFCRAFSMMSKSGIAVTNTLSIVAYVVNNHFVGKKILQMRASVERGENLTQTATRSEMFSPLVLQMLSVGENTGLIDEMLEEIAEFYEREVDYDLKRIGDYIEPIMIVIVGIMVMILALGVFMPIWELAGAPR